MIVYNKTFYSMIYIIEYSRCINMSCTNILLIAYPPTQQLLLIASAAASQRGHYIVDYQRLPLYQEFYLSPGVYRPLITGTQDAVVQSRAAPDTKEGQQPGPPVAQALQQPAPEEAHEAHVVEAAPGPGVQEQQAAQQQQVVLTQQQAALQQQVVQTQQQAAQQQQVIQAQPHGVRLEQQVVQVQPHGVREEQHVAQQEAVHSLPVLQYSNSMTPDGSYSYKLV